MKINERKIKWGFGAIIRQIENIKIYEKKGGDIEKEKEIRRIRKR